MPLAIGSAHPDILRRKRLVLDSDGLFTNRMGLFTASVNAFVSTSSTVNLYTIPTGVTRARVIAITLYHASGAAAPATTFYDATGGGTTLPRIAITQPNGPATTYLGIKELQGGVVFVNGISFASGGADTVEAWASIVLEWQLTDE